MHKYVFLSLLLTHVITIETSVIEPTDTDYEQLESLEKDLRKAADMFDIAEVNKLANHLITNTIFSSLPFYSVTKSNILFVFQSAFINAAKHGHNDFMFKLLDIPGITFDINDFDCDGERALLYVAANGDVDTLHKFLSIPEVNVNLSSCTDYECYTALQAATKKGDLKIVQELLKTPGIDVNRRTTYVDKPLILAIPAIWEDKETYNNKVLIVEELLNAPGIKVTQNDIAYAMQDFCSNEDITQKLTKKYQSSLR